MAIHKGKTQDAQAPMLGAAWWKKGTKIEGIISRSFETTNGLCYEVLLAKPATVNGKPEKKVAIGNLAGLKMALNAAGLDSFESGDKISLVCVGMTPGKSGQSPRVDFDLVLDR
jgi:hypothetical protein